MNKVSPWLDDTPTPDLPKLSDDDLVVVWASNRNNLLGAMAAEESMKRQQNRLNSKLEKST